MTADGPRSFSYDETGNRTMSGYTVTAGIRISSDGTWTYTYDNSGAMTAKSKSGESWAYEYDLNGQMTKASKTVSGSAAGSVEYSYDAFGNRIKRVGSKRGQVYFHISTTRFN